MNSKTETIPAEPARPLQLNRLTLRFIGADAGLETPFLLHYARQDLPRQRLALLAGLLLYILFAILDALVVPEMKHQTWLIRFAVVMPFVLTVVALSYLPHWQVRLQALLAGAFLVAGGGIVLMLVIIPSPANLYYYVGLILVYIFGYTLIKLRFIWASLSGALISVLYGLAALHVSIPPLEMVTFFFFLAGANFAGMLACYHIEYAARHNFYLMRCLLDEQQKIADLNDWLERRVVERTAKLEEANRQLQQEIAERRSAESAMRQLEIQLQQAQKMEAIGQLAGGVAHDFNNMLGVILGYAEMAIDQIGDNRQLYDNLDEIRKAATRSADITRQLLAFARKQTVAPRLLDLNETVAGMLGMLRRLIGEDIDLVWNPGQRLAPIKMDPSQLSQILANLFVNARDALAGVGRIIVETGSEDFDQAYCQVHADYLTGEYLWISVSDNGRGMDEETLSRIFEPFFTTKGVGEGTGLGLATVYGAVKQNNGFIIAESEPGGGTTFTIYLPRYNDAVVLPSPEKTEGYAVHGPETILLVEDEPKILKMTRIMLQRLGYTVLTAATPQEAIGLADEFDGEIHLLLTDVIMPEMNGRDLADKLLSLYPRLKCLFMSGYTSETIVRQGVLAEGIHFIQKPFSKTDLATGVRATLEKN